MVARAGTEGFVRWWDSRRAVTLAWQSCLAQQPLPSPVSLAGAHVGCWECLHSPNPPREAPEWGKQLRWAVGSQEGN